MPEIDKHRGRGGRGKLERSGAASEDTSPRRSATTGPRRDRRPGGRARFGDSNERRLPTSRASDLDGARSTAHDLAMA